jgi:hypothetical protein
MADGVANEAIWGLEVRLPPGTNDGVDAMARMGRDGLSRNGAGDVRACTDIGRRDCDICWAEYAFCRYGLLFVEANGLTGAVTDRLTFTFNIMGARPELDVKEDRRRGTDLNCSVCCCCGRTGRGRRNGLGFAEMRR